jgi:MFS family permease
LNDKFLLSENMQKQAVVPAVAATFALQTLAALALYSIPVFAPVAALEYGVAATQVGVFTAIAYLSAMLTGLLTGAFVTRYGALRVGQACMIFALCGMITFAAGSVWLAIISAILLGLNYGPVNPLSAQILTKVTTPKTRPLIFSIKQSGVTIGGALAGVIVPFLILTFGWRLGAVFIGVAAITLTLFIQPLRGHLDRNRRPTAPLRGSGLSGFLGPIRLLAKDPVTLHLAVMALIYSGVQLTLAAFLVIYLNAKLELSLAESGALFAVSQIGGALGRVFWGVISGALFKPRHVLTALGLISAGSYIVLSQTTPGWPPLGLAILCFILGASSYGWNGVYLSEVATLAPPDKIGEITGGVQFFMFAGAFIAPPVFSLIASLTDSFSTAFITFAVIAGATGLSLTWLSKYHRPEA